jgi:hypothetical protein
VLIGLAPMALMLIPFLRLIFFAVPELMFSAMMMMPILLRS